MIEIKIPTAAAVVLLTQRMRYELGMREKAGKIDTGIGLKNLNYDELLEIAETAAFDIAALLPADIMEDENNVAKIISKSLQSLATIFNKDEFRYYTLEDAEELLSPLRQIFKNINEESFYLVN